MKKTITLRIDDCKYKMFKSAAAREKQRVIYIVLLTGNAYGVKERKRLC